MTLRARSPAARVVVLLAAVAVTAALVPAGAAAQPPSPQEPAGTPTAQGSGNVQAAPPPGRQTPQQPAPGPSPAQPAGSAKAPGSARVQRAQASDSTTGYSDTFGVEVLGHLSTSGGFNAGVTTHGRYAYLGSWGKLSGQADSGEGPKPANPDTCPSHGVRVVDLVDPRHPRLAATFADAASESDVAGSWTGEVSIADVDTPEFSGTLAAVPFQNCQADGFRGFGLYDVTDPTQPQRLHLQQTANPAAANQRSGAQGLWLDETDDGRVFVYTAEINRELRSAENVEIGPDGTVTAGEPTDAGDFRIFEVTDPDGPTLVGQWGAWQDLGVRPRRRDANGVLRTNFLHSVITGTNADGEPRAYLSYWDLGTVILDLSDRSDPTLVGRAGVAANEAGDVHSAWLVDDGRRLIQTHETFVFSHPEEGQGPDPNNVVERAFGYGELLNITDEDEPREVATFELESTRTPPEQLPPGFYTVHNAQVRPGASQAYFSWYAEGAVVMPLPQQPETGTVINQPEAQFVPPPTEDPRGFFFPGKAFPNVYDVAPHEDHAGRPYAVVSDVNSGLWVFRLDEEAPPGSCPEGQVPAAGFEDVSADSPHFAAISCAVHAGITQGVSEQPPRFAPSDVVTRGQMASFLARTLRAAGADLPEAEDAGFADTAGSVHEPAIAALAEAGIVAGVTEDRFAPQAKVKRNQVATFLIRTAEYAVGGPIEPVTRGHFADLTDGPHAPHVDAALELGLVRGTGEDTFEPGAQTRRDQMASLLRRCLDQLEFVKREAPPS